MPGSSTYSCPSGGQRPSLVPAVPGSVSAGLILLGSPTPSVGIVSGESTAVGQPRIASEPGAWRLWLPASVLPSWPTGHGHPPGTAPRSPPADVIVLQKCSSPRGHPRTTFALVPCDSGRPLHTAVGSMTLVKMTVRCLAACPVPVPHRTHCSVVHIMVPCSQDRSVAKASQSRMCSAVSCLPRQR